MMNVLIRLDEERIKADRKYSLIKMWAAIDKLYERGCNKEPQEDGSVLYVGDEKKDYFSAIGIAYIRLHESSWFLPYCLQWVLYDNDDDEELPFQEIDILKRLKEEK